MNITYFTINQKFNQQPATNTQQLELINKILVKILKFKYYQDLILIPAIHLIHKPSFLI